MKPYTINGIKYWFEVFISANEQSIGLKYLFQPMNHLFYCPQMNIPAKDWQKFIFYANFQ